MATVCLCGSTKFMRDFESANVELTKRGHSVFTVSMALTGEKQRDSDEAFGLKVMLDLVHLDKVEKSDAVLVVGPGYVGFSTAREVAWAAMKGVPVSTVKSRANFFNARAPETATESDMWDLVSNSITTNDGVFVETV